MEHKRHDFLKSVGLILLFVGIIYFILRTPLEAELAVPISLIVAGFIIFVVGVFRSKKEK